MYLEMVLLLELRTGNGGIVERTASVCHCTISIQLQAKSQVYKLLLFSADVVKMSRCRTVTGTAENRLARSRQNLDYVIGRMILDCTILHLNFGETG